MKAYKSNQYNEAKKEAKEFDLPLWDTHQLPDRYMVGFPTIDEEEDERFSDWEQLKI